MELQDKFSRYIMDKYQCDFWERSAIERKDGVCV